MTDKHTPGPWEVGDEIMNEDERFVLSSELGGVIASVWPWGDDEEGIGVQNANARLIAAAPDLLAALTDLWESVTNDFGCPWCDDVSWYGEGHGCQFDYVDGLIRKARGEDA